MDYKELLAKTVGIVRNSRNVLEYTENVTIREKSQGNYVTDLDIAMEQYLKKRLSLLIPEAGIISEESAPQIGKFNWIIDPIDGTGNYIHGYPFTISVAYVKNTDETILGIVYDYQKDNLYYALNGGGAFIQYSNNKVEPLGTSDALSDGIALFGMPYNRKKTSTILQIVEKLYCISSDVKRIGPSSLDICAIAEGKAQIYAELDLQPWDTQAGILILEEAGGVVLKKDDLFLFCANEKTKERVLDII